ncbi:SlyX family protein [Pendulispora rubella]|uniref:SlyX family protein n=1 Tax=Pendulispora rubella TaxID=2741070 RepID=A0ABZ2KRI6_9BACT
MSTADPTESRLIELEIRYSHLDRLVEELNRVVFEQGKAIDGLRAELLRMRSRLDDAPEGGRDRTTLLVDEKPPHY